MRRLLRFLLRVAVAFVAASLLGVLVYRVVDPPLTPLMVQRAVAARLAGAPPGIERVPVALGAVSPALLRAVIAAEDARFLAHRGIDLEAVRAAERWNRARRDGRRRGASTITMQTARNVFLWPGGGWVRKGLEAWFAVLLELVWGKARILEVYLNVAEWGPGVFGVEAAARRSFGVSARRLDPQQAALLAAVLPSPLRRDPARPSAFVRARAALIARRAAAVRLGPLAAADAVEIPERSIHSRPR